MTPKRLYTLQTWYLPGEDSAGVNKDDNLVLARTGGNGRLTRNTRLYSSIASISLSTNQKD